MRPAASRRSYDVAGLQGGALGPLRPVDRRTAPLLGTRTAKQLHHRRNLASRTIQRRRERLPLSGRQHEPRTICQNPLGPSALHKKTPTATRELLLPPKRARHRLRPREDVCARSWSQASRHCTPDVHATYRTNVIRGRQDLLIGLIQHDVVGRAAGPCVFGVS